MTNSVLVADEPLTTKVSNLIQNMEDYARFADIDAFLECLDIEKAPLETLFLVMDHTFPNKELLPYWKEFRSRLIREFNNRGLDTNAILGPFMDKPHE